MSSLDCRVLKTSVDSSASSAQEQVAALPSSSSSTTGNGWKWTTSHAVDVESGLARLHCRQQQQPQVSSFLKRVTQCGPLRKLVAFLDPPAPITYEITQHIFPRLGRALSTLVPPHFRLAYLVSYHVLFVVGLVLFDQLGNRAARVVMPGGSGSTSRPQRKLCYDSLMNSQSGTLGVDFGPFPNKTFTVRCPASCNLARTLAPAYAGSTVVQGKAFIVGTDIYRGDSWICPSAVHAGVISTTSGGCVTVTQQQGQFSGFAGSVRNGMESVSFASSYPVAFTFSKTAAADTKFCSDPVLPASIYFYLFLPLIVFGHPSTAHFVVSTSVYVFVFVVFLSADAFHSDADIASAMGQFMPYMAVNLLLIPAVFKRTLPSVGKYSVEVLLMFYPALVVAIQNELIQSQLPAMTLTAAALASPARLTVLIVVLVVFLVAVGAQVHFLRREGQLLGLVGVYSLGALALSVPPLLLNLAPHIHHYMIGMLLMPGVTTQTRLSMVFLGLLWGLYLQGIARWGFDSPFEQQHAAQRAIGLSLGSSLPSWILSPSSPSSLVLSPDKRTVLLSWQLSLGGTAVTDLSAADYATDATAFSLFMNDVQVYRGTVASYNVSIDDTKQRAGLLQWVDPVTFRVVPLQGTATLDAGPVMTAWRNGTAFVAPTFLQN
ncbi:hypothetical protein RI367_003758 [Sorochytrium milnesiophthora]